jgi:hypothetical protein
MADFLDAFNEQTKDMDSSCSQYLYDDGNICRRGLCCGGTHLWENLPSEGTEHLVVDRIPVGEHRLYNGLYRGKKYRQQDDLKVAMITPGNIHKHWALRDQESSVDWHVLSSIAWERRVLIAEAPEQGAWIMDTPFAGGASMRLQKLSTCEIKPAEFDEGKNVLAFFFTPGVAPMLNAARTFNLISIKPGLTVLVFDGPVYGGIVAAWRIKTSNNEIISINGEDYVLLQNMIKRKDNKMKINLDNDVKKAVEIPVVPKAGKTAETVPETTIPKVEPEKADKPAVIKERIEDPSERQEMKHEVRKRAEEYADQLAEEKSHAFDEPLPPTIDGEFEDGIRQLTEILTNPFDQVPKDIKAVTKHFTALRKRVAREMKNSADSAELKTIKAENKELQKRVAALQAAVKSQAELLQKQL